MSAPVLAAGAYAVAVAELPRRAHAAHAVSGSIVVVEGRAGWGARLDRAVQEGAAAIILAEPQGVEIAGPGPLAVPVVVDRARLREDVVADARPASTPRAVQVECGATMPDLPATLRDALGWARSLAGGVLDLRAVRTTTRATLLALDCGGVAVSVLVGRRDAPATWMRALAIDSQRTEVVLQHAVGAPVVTRAGRGGTLRPPPRFESHERLALRRVLDALESGVPPTDLHDLEHDSRIAASALR